MNKRYRYTESGLTNVWLANGYTIRKTKYGKGVSIHDVEGLHRALARALANKLRLTERRFATCARKWDSHSAGSGNCWA